MPAKSLGRAALGTVPVYQSKPLEAHVDDSYKLRGKPAESSVCRQCGVGFYDGRWTWAKRTAEAHAILCPACHRINDAAPAGYLTLEGRFVAEHRVEILRLLRSIELKEKAEHPLQRIMDIDYVDQGIVVTTTDVHLVRAMGKSVHRAYHGEIEFKYGKSENVVRARWTR